MKIHHTLTPDELARRVALGQTDTAIAREFGLGQSTVCAWRRRWGIPKADPFLPNFTQRYGPRAISRFRRMLRQEKTLSEIGQAFGFSREYARQVKNKLQALEEVRHGQ